MTFVVTENCIKCKYMDCVEVCPVDCFYEGPNFLVIHPDECIDCALCEPECPIEAIVSEDDLKENQQEYKELNAELAKKWPNITTKKEAPADAKSWEGVTDKLQYLEKDWKKRSSHSCLRLVLLNLLNVKNWLHRLRWMRHLFFVKKYLGLGGV